MVVLAIFIIASTTRSLGGYTAPILWLGIYGWSECTAPMHLGMDNVRRGGSSSSHLPIASLSSIVAPSLFLPDLLL